MPPGGLNIRDELDQLGQEARLHEYKRAAAAAFIRANGINRMVYSGGRDASSASSRWARATSTCARRWTISASARRKPTASVSVCSRSARPGRSTSSTSPTSSRGLETVVVVEEKRSLIELQLKEALYSTSHRPLVVGKRDERGDWLFPAKGALDPNEIAIALGDRILRTIGPSEEIAARVSRLRQFQAMLAATEDIGQRTPYFCSGCPHNSSTKVPEGSIAAAGIGCHFMALWMDRSTSGFTAMGGEGAQWVGQAPFTTSATYFPESRRRHIQPFRQPGAALRQGGGRQHHLQDPL